MGAIFVIPNKNLKVPYPANPKTYLPEEGTTVMEGVYWTRRLQEGAITLKKEDVKVNKQVIDKKGK